MTLHIVGIHERKRYLTNDPIFHPGEHEILEQIAVAERYRRKGIKTMFYTKMASGVKIMTLSNFLKKKGK